MAASSNYVTWNQSTHMRQVLATTPIFFGWRLENNLYIDRLIVRPSSQVLTIADALIRVAIGHAEPTTAAVHESMGDQLIAGDYPPSLGFAGTGETPVFGSSTEVVVPIGREIKSSGLVLSVYFTTGFNGYVMASLIASGR